MRFEKKLHPFDQFAHNPVLALHNRFDVGLHVYLAGQTELIQLMHAE